MSSRYIYVWEHTGNGSKGDTAWARVQTHHMAGTTDELQYWRVMNATTGGASKDFFLTPDDYFAYSKCRSDSARVTVDRWKFHNSVTSEDRWL